MTPLVRAPNSGSLASFLKAAKTAFASFRDPKPAFTFSIGWARDYDRLFLSDFAETTGTEALLRRALLTGRVFLCSRGGGGKTVILRRLAQHALQEKVVPILLDLKKWTAPDYELWSACGETLVPRMNFLLQQFGVPRLTLLEVDAFPLRAPRLLLVDGLNEVASKTAEDLIGTLDEFVRVAAQTTVIVADRMVRRSFRHPERWQLALVKPLSVEEVELRLSSRPRRGDRASEMDAATKSLFETPFFLDEFLRENEVGLRDWFIRHASLSEQELNEAASGAFAAYASDSARTFPLQTFEAHVGPDVVAKLRTSRALLVEGNLAYFDHHLKHDYLASVHLARTPDHWNRNTFRAVTFDASSFDILAMALQQLDQAQADAFVRQVYDWNPYGAAYAITETRYHHTSPVSPEMERVVLAMLAERRLDMVLATAQRASDALSVFPAADALRFRAANSLEEVFELVRAIDSQVHWFNEWLTLFTRPQGDAVRDEELPTLMEGNSVLGWTFANVLKRMSVEERQLQVLRSWLRDNVNPTVRWRIAHALGAFPSLENATSLLARLDTDNDGLVRYGATRSLVELAARGGVAVRSEIFGALAQRAGWFLTDKPCLDELTRVVFIRTDRAPPHWASSVLTVVKALYIAVVDSEKKEQWARLG